MKKHIIPAIAATLFLAAFTVFNAHADGEISARSAILMEAHTGAVLYEKGADERLPIASTTKLMTALVTLENASLEDTVTVPAACERVEGSSMYLKPGESYSVRELLYGLMLESGNDAAVALAVHIAGSVEAFADMMNDRAAALGLENTHFLNPHGLHEDGHYSSARDLALIMGACMEDPLFVEIASTKSITFGGRTYTNHNKLMWSYEGMVTGKTGYTKKAGRTLVTCAQRDGMRLICVTLRDGDDWADHETLLNRGFSQWQMQTPVRTGDILGRVPVMAGSAASVSVRAASGVSLLTEAGEELTVQVSLPRFVYAGVTEGAFAGTAYVLQDGRQAAAIPLEYAESVSRDKPRKRTLSERIWEFFNGE